MYAEQLADAYRKVECGLELIGVTGIEDRLQEGVKDTIEKLRAAGIKVWVLTGDKEETAINVAYSSGLFDQHTRKLLLTRQPDIHAAIARASPARAVRPRRIQSLSLRAPHARGPDTLSHSLLILARLHCPLSPFTRTRTQ